MARGCNACRRSAARPPTSMEGRSAWTRRVTPPGSRNAVAGSIAGSIGSPGTPSERRTADARSWRTGSAASSSTRAEARAMRDPTAPSWLSAPVTREGSTERMGPASRAVPWPRRRWCQHGPVRLIVYGPGAIGGVVGGGLHRAGHQVTLIARGAHRDAIASGGLVLELPGERLILDVPVVSSPAEVDWSGHPAVLVAVKSQDTSSVLDALVAAAPPDTVVACLQNGVDNERRVLRHFANTYAVCVMCPATHLRPGVVQAHSAPVTALRDIGLPVGCRWHRRGDRRGTALGGSRQRGASRHHAVEVPQAGDERAERRRRALRAGGPAKRPRPLRTSRGGGVPAAGRHRRGLARRRPPAQGRPALDRADRQRAARGLVVVAEPRPGRQSRSGLPERRDRAPRPAHGVRDARERPVEIG